MAEKKLRMTQQRQLILDELKKTYEHPSACEIYEKVKQRLPHISLGTVYRNLEVLSSNGVIKRLDMTSGQRRFDAGIQDHHHIRCISCGRVDDLPATLHISLRAVLSNVGEATGYHETGCSVGFFGLCPNCVKKPADTH
jgi:Fur family transcriptional regulator, ferric uptake regulator